MSIPIYYLTKINSVTDLRSTAAFTEVTDLTASANEWDRRTGVIGCDPGGCVATNTIDGSTAPDSRWSCQVSNDEFCELTISFGVPQDIAKMRLALHKGNERIRSVNVWANGDLVTTVTSSGMTLGYESFRVIAPDTTTIVLQAAGLEPNGWLSITEVSRQEGREGSDRFFPGDQNKEPTALCRDSLFQFYPNNLKCDSFDTNFRKRKKNLSLFCAVLMYTWVAELQFQMSHPTKTRTTRNLEVDVIARHKI